MNFLGMGRPQPSSAEKIAMVESEIRLNVNILERLTRSCQKKCLNKDFIEDNLSKGEGVCLDRCVSKFFETYVKASEVMAQKQQDMSR